MAFTEGAVWLYPTLAVILAACGIETVLAGRGSPVEE